jgi:predicted nucleotidyltransferase
MLRESNCSILEWLLSPCIYMKHDSFHTRAIELVSEFTSRKTLVFHYINMAKKHRVEYFDGKENVDLKKYFFVIRPLLCVLWLKKNASCKYTALATFQAGFIDHHTVSTPPQDLEKLMSEVTVPVEAQKVLLNLIKQKREGNLSSSSPTDAILGRGPLLYINLATLT